MSGNIFSLADHRARRVPVAAPPKPPQEIIVAAADLWLSESVRLVAESLVNRITVSNAPLRPHERASLMRAAAALHCQPED